MPTEAEKQRNREVYRERVKKKSRNIWLFIGVIILLYLFGGPVWGLVGVNIHYSEGERTVKIIKLGEKGWIWKTWEIEGVLTQGDLTATYIWEFSIDNQDVQKAKLLHDLQTAFETGQVVKVRYDQRAGNVPWRSGTPYFVTEIRFP